MITSSQRRVEHLVGDFGIVVAADVVGPAQAGGRGVAPRHRGNDAHRLALRLGDFGDRLRRASAGRRSTS